MWSPVRYCLDNARAVQVEGIGECRARGEFWVLTYDTCGHEQWFMHRPMNYADAAVEREVRAYYATCATCSPPAPLLPKPDPRSYYGQP